MTAQTLAHTVKETAAHLGFDFCRIIQIGPGTAAPHADFFERWLDLGRVGEMGYLARHGKKRRLPALLAEETEASFHSMIVLGVDYHRFDLPPEVLDDPSRGIIARYAWGDDYHEIIRPLLYELDGAIRKISGRSAQGKGLVDTGPVLERDWAMQAGLGFTGKNCCTIHPGMGSWLLLATLLIPEEVAPDPAPTLIRQPDIPLTPTAVAAGLPPKTNLGTWQPANSPLATRPSQLACGTCTRCLTACPTDAFVGPLHLDPARCISYWTIEARSPIPRELRPQVGNRIFGCDICQEVCPWNHRLAERTPLLAGLRAQDDRVAPFLLDGFAPENPYWLDQAAFSAHFRRSPIKRPKRAGMLRNVCVALGNWGDVAAIPALSAALVDPDPLPRLHAAWGLGQILARHRHASVGEILRAALGGETDERVMEELRLADLH
jgi:epoxyqueuosine reductase